MEEGAPLAVDDRGRSSGGSQLAELGVGVIGAGFIGRVHARSARLAGGRLVGVAASTPERSDTAGRELGAERAFASAEELVGSAEVDVVHICTPNHLHLNTPLTHPCPPVQQVRPQPLFWLLFYY